MKNKYTKLMIGCDLNFIPLSKHENNLQNTLRKIYRVQRKVDLLKDCPISRKESLKKSLQILKKHYPKAKPKFDKKYFEFFPYNLKFKNKIIWTGLLLLVLINLKDQPNQTINKPNVKLEERLSYKYDKKIQHLKKILEPKAWKYIPYVVDACEKYKHIYPTDPYFVLSLIREESDYYQFAISKVGAAGPMQIMPYSALKMGFKKEDIFYPKYYDKAWEAKNLASKYFRKSNRIREKLKKYALQPSKYKNKINELRELEFKYFCEAVRKEKEATALFNKYRNELKKKKDKRFEPKAIYVGVKSLAESLKEWGGDKRVAAAAHNAGRGAVEKYKGIPPFDETIRFQNRVCYPKSKIFKK